MPPGHVLGIVFSYFRPKRTSVKFDLKKKTLLFDLEFRFTCLDPFPRKTGSKNTRLDLNSRGFGPDLARAKSSIWNFGSRASVARSPALESGHRACGKNTEKAAGLESRDRKHLGSSTGCRVWKFVHALFGPPKVILSSVLQRVSSHSPQAAGLRDWVSCFEIRPRTFFYGRRHAA